MTERLGVGIIGCGNISAAYMQLGPMFRGIEIRACADLNLEAAQARADEFGIAATSVDDLLARDDIDIVVNLTIPAAHHGVSSAVLDAGKHVYSEKPFVLSAEEGAALVAKADAAALRVGSAPDTFLGGSHQLARHIIDEGAIGQVTSGIASVQSRGMESWHPNPDFFFLPGAGPVLDIGPYYISNLVQLIGPVKSVQALTATPQATRTIGSGPRAGEIVPVKTPTTIHALLEFHTGAAITLIASWDVWAHDLPRMELYGADGMMSVPDPNFFGGDVRLTKGGDAVPVPNWDHPFSVPNFGASNEHANYRAAGLADMALAIQDGRDHRCSAAFAHHIVDVMTGILKAGETGHPVTLSTTCDRPAPLDAVDARALMC
ncbi:Gfo/Idh/MocA family oxidoreductase [Gymnodinialimonas sp. 2305UL16-5]|uniref:Gfo/Idh/MocA family protein n=1 Tax=Gymnodinialimonas mytili TaxID=3126503 RepID=UPI0030AA866D